MRTRDNAKGRRLWTGGVGGAGGDEYTLDTAAASLAGLALWVAERTGLIAIEVPQAGLTPRQGLETARLLAALGADGCDVRMSTDNDVVIEELGAIAADARVRRTGERGERLPRPESIRRWRVDGDPANPDR